MLVVCPPLNNFLTQMETSTLSVKTCKFWRYLCSKLVAFIWEVMWCTTFILTGDIRFNVIVEDPWHLHLLPITVTILIRTHDLLHARRLGMKKKNIYHSTFKYAVILWIPGRFICCVKMFLWQNILNVIR